MSILRRSSRKSNNAKETTIDLELLFNNDSSVNRNIIINSNSYSQIISEDIDPRSEEQSRHLRSGLVFPVNPAIVPHQYKKFSSKPRSHHFSITYKSRFVKKLFRCYLCSEVYLNMHALEKHMQMRHLCIYNKSMRMKNDQICTHFSNKPCFYCKLCEKEFHATPIINENEGKSYVSHVCTHSKYNVNDMNIIYDQSNIIKDVHSIDDISMNMNMNENSNLLLLNKNVQSGCGLNRNAFDIKRVRYSCRTNCNVSQVEQWLKYELNKQQLSSDDYLNCARMFIAVAGYDIAIQMIEQSIHLYANDKNSRRTKKNVITERRLIQAAKLLMESENQ